MTSIVSAITGSGAKKAASAQVGAYTNAQEIAAQTLEEQLKLGREALSLQKEMYNSSLEMTDPYRKAGETALAQYESLIYGIPISETSTYKAASTTSSGALNTNPVTQFYSSPEELREAARGYHSSTNPEYQDRMIFLDSNTGEVGWSGDIPLYKSAGKDKSGYDPLAQATEAYNRLANQEEETQDLSYFGDASQAADFTTTPGYEFRRDEGQKAIDRSAAARTGVLSGAQLKATERYSQDYATQEFDNVLNRLSGLINTGANASGAAASNAITSANSQSGVLGQMASYQGTYGDTAASLETAIGAAKASGYLGQQQAGTNILNMASGMFGAYYGAGGAGSASAGSSSAGTGFVSDIRLKENFEPLGQENGHNIYKFNYIGHPEKFIGVIADEVEKTNPEAIGELNGYKTVDYAKIGVQFRRA